jgi:hypothetical protein
MTHLLILSFLPSLPSHSHPDFLSSPLPISFSSPNLVPLYSLLFRQVRITQGKEPPHFLALFKGKTIVHKGGKASSFNNTDQADRYHTKPCHAVLCSSSVAVMPSYRDSIGLDDSIVMSSRLLSFLHPIPHACPSLLPPLPSSHLPLFPFSFSLS